MPKGTGKNSIILVNGNNYSTYSTAYNGEENFGLVDVTGFTDGGRNFIPGQLSGKLSIDMLWDSTATVGDMPVMSAFPTGAVTIIPEGYTLGTTTLSMPFMTGNFSPSGEPAGAVKLGTLNFENYGASSYGIEHGWALAHGTITDTTTGTPVLDPTDAAATALCGGTLHIWTPCAADTYVVKVQHCATSGGVYADLITFVANGSAKTVERQVIASGTINKYRRVLATRTGAAANPFGFSVHFWHA